MLGEGGELARWAPTLKGRDLRGSFGNAFLIFTSVHLIDYSLLQCDFTVRLLRYAILLMLLKILPILWLYGR